MMRIQEIQRLATALGIEHVRQKSGADLIRHIRFEEGHLPCFSEAWSAPCNIGDCPFSDACSSHFSVSEMVGNG